MATNGGNSAGHGAAENVTSDPYLVESPTPEDDPAAAESECVHSSLSWIELSWSLTVGSIHIYIYIYIVLTCLDVLGMHVRFMITPPNNVTIQV